MKRLKNDDVGRTCLVRWTDVGRVESMILEIDDDKKSAKVYSFHAEAIKSVDSHQISDIGNKVTPIM